MNMNRAEGLNCSTYMKQGLPEQLPVVETPLLRRPVRTHPSPCHITVGGAFTVSCCEVTFCIPKTALVLLPLGSNFAYTGHTGQAAAKTSSAGVELWKLIETQRESFLAGLAY
jgi:hypothetical protein